jgi:transposase
LLCFVTAGSGLVAEADADAPLRDVLAAALEANERLAGLAEELRAENARLREENARLRERDAQREAELERVSAELAVLQRLVFGRSSERARPGPAGGHGDGDGGRAGGGRPRGPGARAGRRDYSHLPGSR